MMNSLADMQLEAKRLKERNEQLLLQVAYSIEYHCNQPIEQSAAE